MLIEGNFPVAAPPEALLQHLFDARLMASCLPGCESLERLDDDRYRAIVVVALAGVRARFDLLVQITGRDERNIWAVTRGEEGGYASALQADSQVSLEPTADGTLVSYRSEVSVTGRLGRFALGMMKKKAQSMGDEFAGNLRRESEALGTTQGADKADAATTDTSGTTDAGTADVASATVAPWWRRLWLALLGQRPEVNSKT
ncbi:MAG: CoxG family protein [Cupriavidus necator]